MSIRSRKIFWILPILVIVIGGGAFLYTQGLIPGTGGADVDVADTTTTAADAEALEEVT